MSDYANLREYCYALMNPDPPLDEGMLAFMAADKAAFENRNPEPEIEPALLLCRTQAEWFAVQDALSAETPTADQTALLAELRALADDDEPPVTPPPVEEPPPTEPVP